MLKKYLIFLFCAGSSIFAAQNPFDCLKSVYRLKSGIIINQRNFPQVVRLMKAHADEFIANYKASSPAPAPQVVSGAGAPPPPGPAPLHLGSSASSLRPPSPRPSGAGTPARLEIPSDPQAALRKTEQNPSEGKKSADSEAQKTLELFQKIIPSGASSDDIMEGNSADPYSGAADDEWED